MVYEEDLTNALFANSGAEKQCPQDCSWQENLILLHGQIKGADQLTDKRLIIFAL